MTDLNFKLERNIIICAQRKTVFRYFTDSKRWASWWGEGSTIEAKPGGQIRICYPGAVLAIGEILEITNNERIVFTYGYESGKPIPAGSSKITFLFRDHPEGTEVAFRHEFEDAAVRDMHVAGWRYQLALFANVVCKEQHANYKQILADYLTLWNTADSASRSKIIARITAPNIRFNDPYGCANDQDDFNGHIESARKHMPLTLSEASEPVECQGHAIQQWVAKKEDGTEAARGVNTFQFTPDGLIGKVIGFWIPKS